MTISRCVVCGRILGASWVVDQFDEDVCTSCSTASRCFACEANTGGSGVRAATVLPDGRVRCARCSRGAVDDRAAIGPVVRLVRPFLHSLGLRLPNRVRVELLLPAEMTRRTRHGGLGYTESVATGIGPPTVVEIAILQGLPPTSFGSTLAHEMAHGWLAGCPNVGMSSQEEEGLCELVASWWLEHRGGRLAAALLTSMRRSPDPLYGEGFRQALRATEGMTPTAVVAHVSRAGCLP